MTVGAFFGASAPTAAEYAAGTTIAHAASTTAPRLTLAPQLGLAPSSVAAVSAQIDPDQPGGGG